MDLFETQKTLKEIESLKSKYSNNERKIAEAKIFNGSGILRIFEKVSKIILVAFFILNFVLGLGSLAPIKGIIGNILTFIGESLILPVIYSVIVGVPLYIVFCIIRKILYKIHNSRSLTTFEKETTDKLIGIKNEIDSEYQSLQNSLEESEIPPDYRNMHAVDWMARAYNNNRAETITKLVNLYEQELTAQRHNQLVENLIYQNQTLSAQVNQANTSMQQMGKDLKSVKSKVHWW